MIIFHSDFLIWKVTGLVVRWMWWCFSFSSVLFLELEWYDIKCLLHKSDHDICFSGTVFVLLVFAVDDCLLPCPWFFWVVFRVLPDLTWSSIRDLNEENKSTWKISRSFRLTRSTSKDLKTKEESPKEPENQIFSFCLSLIIHVFAT